MGFYLPITFRKWKMEVIGPWANMCFCYVTQSAKNDYNLFPNDWAHIRYLLSKLNLLKSARSDSSKKYPVEYSKSSSAILTVHTGGFSQLFQDDSRVLRKAIQFGKGRLTEEQYLLTLAFFIPRTSVGFLIAFGKSTGDSSISNFS